MAMAETMSDLLEMANKNSDPRTLGWFFVTTPLPMFAVTAIYLTIIRFGPGWMAKREPFQLKSILVVYNLGLVILSAWMVKEFVVTALMKPGFHLICEPVDYSDDPLSIRLANVIWWYYFSKMIEYFETVFFVLRKKNNQISFLHVYHHVSMPCLWYLGVRYLAGGTSYFAAMINCFVHVLMYGYYFLSAFGPKMQPYLWWKRYLTSLQLIQFNLVMLHVAAAYYLDCGYPRSYMIALFCYCISLFVLFSNFFYHNYLSKGKGRSKNAKVSAKHPDLEDSFTNGHTPLTNSSGTSATRRVLVKE